MEVVYQLGIKRELWFLALKALVFGLSQWWFGWWVWIPVAFFLFFFEDKKDERVSFTNSFWGLMVLSLMVSILPIGHWRAVLTVLSTILFAGLIILRRGEVGELAFWYRGLTGVAIAIAGALFFWLAFLPGMFWLIFLGFLAMIWFWSDDLFRLWIKDEERKKLMVSITVWILMTMTVFINSLPIDFIYKSILLLTIFLLLQEYMIKKEDGGLNRIRLLSLFSILVVVVTAVLVVGGGVR